MTRRAESYSEAAARRAFENMMLERQTAADTRRRELGVKPPVRIRSAVASSTPGAFSAVASASDLFDHGLGVSAGPDALRPLPRAVLVHAGHEPDARPVAVAVPSFEDGTVRVDAVFASLDPAARKAWKDVQDGRLPSVSIHAVPTEYFRADFAMGRMLQGVLVAVDLCGQGLDERAKVTKIVDALTPAQREVQRRFDAFLADPDRPSVTDLMMAARSRGAGALEPLRPIVAPLMPGWTPPKSSAAPAPAVRTGGRPQAQRCPATLDERRCEEPRGHGGDHFEESDAGCARWDDRSCGARSTTPSRARMAALL